MVVNTWENICGCRGTISMASGSETYNTDHYCIGHDPRLTPPSPKTFHDLFIEYFRKDRKDTKSTTDGTNPKDLVGNKKVSITKLPAVAILHASHAMMHGAKLYGPYNWRENKVQAEIYIDAAMRHITAWNEREECATDSGVHHLGHAMACLAILLDAQESGNLVDNRPQSNGSFQKVLTRLNAAVAEEAAK